MRIALVITELDPGGAETCLAELALYLHRLGHAVKVWSIGPPPASGRDQLSWRLTAAGIEVAFGNALGLPQAPRTIRWLKRGLRDFRPDLVQSMLWHANMITAGALWFNHVPWVGGMRVSEPRSGRWWLERAASRRMQRLVCVSQDVSQHALLRERIDQSKLVVIPNGVSELWLKEDLVPGDWNRLIGPVAPHVLLFAGRLEAQKGVLPLVQHAPQFLSETGPWSLVLIGQGSLQAALETNVQRLNLSKQIHFPGWQPESPRWMKASELVLLPAEYEGMPNVLLEAMAVGRAFVAFAVDGVSQLVDTSQGYPAELAAAQLAAPGDWNEFIRLVRQQMHHPELRQRCGQANRAHLLNHFRLEQQLSKYLALYESLTRPLRDADGLSR